MCNSVLYAKRTNFGAVHLCAVTYATVSPCVKLAPALEHHPRNTACEVSRNAVSAESSPVFMLPMSVPSPYWEDCDLEFCMDLDFGEEVVEVPVPVVPDAHIVADTLCQTGKRSGEVCTWREEGVEEHAMGKQRVAVV
jgi:hypothetical protein